MSIILKGIDLPNCSNEDCIVVIRKNKAEVWQTGFKERTIEAIQIPKRHGKLIPLEDVFRAFPELEPYRQGLTGLTILESEET